MAFDEQLRGVVRAAVLDRLADAVDQRETVSIGRFIGSFDALDRPFDEGRSFVHVTGSAIVVGPRGVLLHLHKRAQIWIQPGGHVDDGESPWDGAVRETFEETGLVAVHPAGSVAHLGVRPTPVLIHVDVHDAPKGHIHLDLRYLLIGPDEDPAPPPGESQQVGWFGWNDPLLQRESLAGAISSSQRWLTENLTALVGQR